MSGPTTSAPTSAAINGPRWGARAADWAELTARISTPAWQAVAEAVGIGRNSRVLDVGCGSGEFCRLAAARGAEVSGIDAAEGMIELARRSVPDGDLRVGALEILPWPNDSFDVVTGFNAFQFAADLVAALAEARRVASRGGRVAICNWSALERSQLLAVFSSLRELQPPPAPGPPSNPPAIGEPGVLEHLARQAGLDPLSTADVDVPFETPDRATLERALTATGGVTPAIEQSGEESVRRALVEAAAPFRRPDGSYRFENRFTYLIAEA